MAEPEDRSLLAVSPFPVLPVVDGATLRVAELLRELSRSWSVQLVSPTSPEKDEDLHALGVRSHRHVSLVGEWTYWPWQYDTTPLVRGVERQIAAQGPHVGLLWKGSEFLADRLSGFPPFVADRVDCATRMAWSGRNQTRGWRERLRWVDSLFRMSRYERRVARLPYATVVVGEGDARWLRGISGAPNVVTIPNGVRVEPDETPPEQSPTPTVVFSGVMAYPPNVDAVRYFADAVWPRIRRRRAEARFEIVGRGPSADVQALAEVPGIDVLGEVEDLRAVVGRAWIAVAPMRSGTGIKNKVLEAWATGTPVVMSSLATNGLGEIDEFADLIADEPEAMAAVIVRLLDDAEERSRLGELALRAARQRSWSHAAARMSRLLERARRAR